MDERGQTQYDFAIGVSVFLLVLIGVLVFLPSVFASYDTPVGADQREEADRLADRLVTEHRAGTNERTLNLSGSDGLATAMGATEFATLRDGAGVLDDRRVNVTVVDGGRASELVEEGGDAVATGPMYDDRPAATTVRVVRFADSDVCSPLCRIVVRVW